MPFFQRRTHATTTTRTHRGPSRFSRFGRKDPDRVAGGFKAALSNPNTTRHGRSHAKRELRLMGRGRETHVPVMTKIKRALGIRSSPRRKRTLGGTTVGTSSTRRRRTFL
ncbi:hypothetical protein BXZ70DRAFT_1004556 [Cristinia sonorae]|uniref:Uncharacterized protein n=1 Tax=Cristinia sonorae TaxID=1940300 RepID=A0A8K0UWC1_9AGAR|nr:hypothetical protein BXZ70DRAFT_1004556 [Cristinia sonorae]